MGTTHENHEGEDAMLLNNRNEFAEGITARAVVQRDSGSITLVRNPAESAITLIGCDATDEDREVFGLSITVTSVYYDTEGRPDCCIVDPMDRFVPTEAEIVAARGGVQIAEKNNSDATEKSTEDRSSEQSNRSGQSKSSRSSPTGIGTGIVVDGSGERDKAGRSPIANKNMMKNLLGKKKQ